MSLGVKREPGTDKHFGNKLPTALPVLPRCVYNVTRCGIAAIPASEEGTLVQILELVMLAGATYRLLKGSVYITRRWLRAGP